MKSTNFHFSTLEFAGSLGDLGTLIPLSLGMIMVCGLSTSTVFIIIGLFYISTGLYFRLPVPVQPLKVVAAIAIAYPGKITIEMIAAAGMIFGVILLISGVSGLIDQMAKFFKKSIVRGIQLGLGLILASKGLSFILRKDLFSWNSATSEIANNIPLNLILGIVMVVCTLLFMNSKRFPAALVVMGIGIIAGIASGGLENLTFQTGITGFSLYMPSIESINSALFLLVIPQIPLTLGNAVIGTADTCFTLFGKGQSTEKISYRSLAISMGISNCIAGLFGAMPMCHGAGGLAAHHRFGARTGGSNLMIGVIFIILGLFFGKLTFRLLSCLPNAVFGTLLLFAGLELSLLIRDIHTKKELFVALLIGCIAIHTSNMGIAFVTGIVVDQMMQWKHIEL